MKKSVVCSSSATDQIEQPTSQSLLEFCGSCGRCGTAGGWHCRLAQLTPYVISHARIHHPSPLSQARTILGRGGVCKGLTKYCVDEHSVMSALSLVVEGLAAGLLCGSLFQSKSTQPNPTQPNRTHLFRCESSLMIPLVINDYEFGDHSSRWAARELAWRLAESLLTKPFHRPIRPIQLVIVFIL